MALVRCATPGCDSKLDQAQAAKRDGRCLDCAKDAKRAEGRLVPPMGSGARWQVSKAADGLDARP